MAEHLRADPHQLRETSRFVADKAQALREQVKRLDDTIGKRLLGEGWAGTAALGYDGSWTDWKQGADTIIAALDEAAAKLTDTATAYELQDRANRDGIARIRLNTDV